MFTHGLVCGVNRRGDCHDNAQVGGFFGLLEGDRVERRIDQIERGQNVFDYIEVFYNLKRLHGSNGDLSPLEFEQRYAHRGPACLRNPGNSNRFAAGGIGRQ